MSQQVRSVAKRILPRSWWDELRRLKRRSPDLVSPRAMHHLRRIRDQGFRPEVVVDVGAAHGDWTVSCRRIFPYARYVMVEPLPEYEVELSGLVQLEQVEYVKAAAGRSAGTLPLLVPDEPGGSSFLPASRPGDTYFKRSVTVPVIALDDLDIPSGSVLLKLDVQGYELEVLAGAERLLERVDAIIVETSLHRFQQNIPLTHEVIRLLDLGFRLYDVADEFRWNSGTLAQIDLVFVAEGSALLGEQWWH